MFHPGSNAVWLTSCLTGFYSTKQKNKLLIQHKQSSLILTIITAGQPYTDTSPYEVSVCSLHCPISCAFAPTLIVITIFHL